MGWDQWLSMIKSNREERALEAGPTSGRCSVDSAVELHRLVEVGRYCERIFVFGSRKGVRHPTFRRVIYT